MSLRNLSALVSSGDSIEFVTQRRRKVPARIERPGVVFPALTNGRPTTLSDITGRKKDKRGNPGKRGLAKRFPHDLHQAVLQDGKRVLLFCIETPNSAGNSVQRVTYYKDERHELLLSAVLSQGQNQVRLATCRERTLQSSFLVCSHRLKVAKKARELNNRVPGDPERILWSEDTVEKLSKNIKMVSPENSEKMQNANNTESDMETQEETVKATPPPKRKPGRPRKKKDGEDTPRPKPKSSTKASFTAKSEKPAKKPAAKPQKRQAKKDTMEDAINDFPVMAAAMCATLESVFSKMKKGLEELQGPKRGRGRKRANGTEPPAKRSKVKPSDEFVETEEEEEILTKGDAEELLDL